MWAVGLGGVNLMAEHIVQRARYDHTVSSRIKMLSFFFAALFIFALDYQAWVGLHPLYEDDAYYYFIIARNVVEHGRSSFDGQVLTNGYHPFWLAILSLVYTLFGTFGSIPHVIELLCVLGGLACLLAALPSRSPLDNLLLGLSYVAAVRDNTLNGMETSLTVFCLAALIFCMERLDLSKRQNVVLTGLIAVACVGARIDAVVFVAPLLYFALPAWRDKALGFAILGGFGLVYLVFNEAIFHMAFPISGTIKSLGGIQFNHVLLARVAEEWTGRGLYAEARPIVSDTAPMAGLYHMVGLALIAMPLYRWSAREPQIRRLIAGYLIGMALYSIRLLYFSSWTVWPWYFFPSVLGAYACLRGGLSALDRLQKDIRHNVKRAALGLLALVLMLPVKQSFAAHITSFGYREMGEITVEKYGALLNGSRVAMGDRAGGFAIVYQGPVTQLEGLVGDGEYLRALEGRRDLKALLCQRQVKYILNYEVDLGSYQTHRIKILRPRLTDYPGPEIQVSKADEVGRVSDPRFFAASWPEYNRYIYIWRLSGCV